MSPAATRHYIVGFKSWTMYEAVAKGKALYNLKVFASFSVSAGGEEPWPNTLTVRFAH